MTASAAAVATISGVDADTAYRIESALSKLKGPLLDAVTKVCGLSKNRQWESETRWWNEEVDEAIREKCTRFKAYSALKEGRHDGGGQGSKNCLHWRQACGKAWHLVGKVWSRELGIHSVSPDGDSVLSIAKQMDCTNRTLLMRSVHTMMLACLCSLTHTQCTWRLSHVT